MSPKFVISRQMNKGSELSAVPWTYAYLSNYVKSGVLVFAYFDMKLRGDSQTNLNLTKWKKMNSTGSCIGSPLLGVQFEALTGGFLHKVKFLKLRRYYLARDRLRKMLLQLEITTYLPLERFGGGKRENSVLSFDHWRSRKKSRRWKTLTEQPLPSFQTGLVRKRSSTCRFKTPMWLAALVIQKNSWPNRLYNPLIQKISPNLAHHPTHFNYWVESTWAH